MSKKRKSQEDLAEPDLGQIVSKFNVFVKSLADLIHSTPEDNFSLRGLDSDAEDRAVIAKVLKRMHLKGQLSWMDQYLKVEDVVQSSPLPPSEIAPYKDSASSTLRAQSQLLDLSTEIQTSNGLPPLPAMHNQALLNQAFTHRSYATACAPAQSTKVFLTSLHNERLEFLGDSFLNHSVTKMLFSQLPEAREGELSLLRAELIGNNTAAEFGRGYEFDKKLLLNDTAERDGVRKTPKVIADTFEAYLGALILDGPDGVVRADNWLKALMAPRIKDYIDNSVQEPVDTFAKQRVWNHFVKLHQTAVMAMAGTAGAAFLGENGAVLGIEIKYPWVDGGGGNEGGFIVAAKLFDTARKIDGEELGRGFGLKKKEAEHRAAMDALKRLGI